MAKSILATTPLSHHHIESLGQLFARAFCHLKEQSVLSEQIYQKRLFFEKVHKVVGLAFTAVLVEKNSLALFEPCLNHFLNYSIAHNPQEAAIKAGLAMGDIISLGSDAFRTLGHPDYYFDFLAALQDTLSYCVTEFRIPRSSTLTKVIALIM